METWADWQAYENQAAPIAWDPAPVAYDGTAMVYYAADGGDAVEPTPTPKY